MSPPINNEGGGRLFFFTGVSGVRWKSPVTPGDQLVMEMNLESFDDRLGFAKMAGKAYVGGKVSIADYMGRVLLQWAVLTLSWLVFSQLAVQVDEFTFAMAKSP